MAAAEIESNEISIIGRESIGLFQTFKPIWFNYIAKTNNVVLYLWLSFRGERSNFFYEPIN